MTRLAPSGPSERDAVSVLTVHKAKGLEFATVFVVGLADGRFPGRGRREAIELPSELRRSAAGAGEESLHAEERRLCYVAMTRARDELLLSMAASPERGRRRRPSPFLAEALDDVPALPELVPAVERIDVLAAGLAMAGIAPDGAAGRRSRGRAARPELLRARQLPRLPGQVPLPSPAAGAGAGAPRPRRRQCAPPGGGGLQPQPHEGPPARRSGHRRRARRPLVGRGLHLARPRGGPLCGRARRGPGLPSADLAAGSPPAAGIESRFSVVLEGVRVDGRYDRVDRTDEGVVITDYKSSDVRDPARARQRARESLQLAIYALAHEASEGELPVAVQLHFLESGLVGRVPVGGEAPGDRAGQGPHGQRGHPARAPSSRARTSSPAGTCPFRRICPAAVG